MTIYLYWSQTSIKTQKEGKSPGFDNIPSELIKHGGNNITIILTTLYKLSWASKVWPSQWIKSLIIPIPKKGDSKKCNSELNLSFQ